MLSPTLSLFSCPSCMRTNGEDVRGAECSSLLAKKGSLSLRAASPTEAILHELRTFVNNLPTRRNCVRIRGLL